MCAFFFDRLSTPTTPPTLLPLRSGYWTHAGQVETLDASHESPKGFKHGS